VIGLARVLTKITLYKNVPIQPGFKDEPLFTSETDQNNWFGKYKYKEFDSSYQRVEEQIRSPYKYEDLVDVNYIKIVNPSYEGADEELCTWYGIVMGTNYINDDLVLIDWVVNPVQTFMFRWILGMATVERGMTKLTEENANRYYKIADDRIPILANSEPIGIDGSGMEIARDNILNDNRSGAHVTYMIIVLKDADAHSFVGSPGQRSYYVMPFNKNTGALINYKVNNVPAATASGIQKINLAALNNAGNGNIVNAIKEFIGDTDLIDGGGAIIASYFQTDVGLGLELTNGVLETTLPDNEWAMIDKNMELYPEGNSSGGGGNGGTNPVPEDQLEFLKIDIANDFGVDQAKFLQGAKQSARVQQWLGSDNDNILRVAEIVKNNGMSPELFFAYDIQEQGTYYGWLNHTTYTGDPYQDADSVSKWAVSQANTTGRVELAWTDVANPYYTTPPDKQAEGQAFADALAKGAIGRMYLSGTAAATWAAFDPDALKKEVNQVQDYGNPIRGCMDLLTAWQIRALAATEFLPPLAQPFVVTSEFGDRDGSWHNGIDVAVNGNPIDRPVYASAAGEIIAAEDTRVGSHTGWDSYGLYVAIRHSNGFCTGYAHLNSIDVAVGDRVNQGQKIGVMGTTGNSSGIHVHFQVITDNPDGGWLPNTSPLFINPRNKVDFSLSGGIDTGGGDGGNPGGGDDGRRQWLKINTFMKPIERKKTLEFSSFGQVPKYHTIRELLNRGLAENDSDTIDYINSLQGSYGLEKLCCAPFTTLLLTTGKGSQKSVSLADFKDQEDPFEVNIRGFLDLSNWVELYFDDYLTYYKDKEKLEAVIRKDSIIDNAPKNIELIIDAEDQYLYLNKNRLQQSRDNALLSLEQTNIQQGGSQRSFAMQQEGARTAIGMQQANDRKNLQTKQTQGWYNTAYSAATGAVSGLIFGGGVGLGGSLLNSAIGAAGQGMNNMFDTTNMQISQGQANAMLAQSQNVESAIFRNSLDTASLIASNNYDNAIANINAGLADMRLQPDVSAISASGYNFEMGWDNDDYHVILYTINPHQLRLVAEFFARFGYSIKTYTSVSDYLTVRSSFNYVKTVGVNIKGNFSNKWRESLNLIFDNGITFWREHDKMASGDITGNL
jgi:murein DD-endopeptidase MepM/ murein hydrolase activator NlpD